MDSLPSQPSPSLQEDIDILRRELLTLESKREELLKQVAQEEAEVAKYTASLTPPAPEDDKGHQRMHDIVMAYRLTGVTIFDPNELEESNWSEYNIEDFPSAPKEVGIRFETFANAGYHEPYYVLITKETNAQDGSLSKLRISKHTIPHWIPLREIAKKHLNRDLSKTTPASQRNLNMTSFTYGYAMGDLPGDRRIVTPPMLGDKISLSLVNTTTFVFIGTRPAIIEWFRTEGRLKAVTAIVFPNRPPLDLVFDLFPISNPDMSWGQYFESFYYSDPTLERYRLEIRPEQPKLDGDLQPVSRMYARSGVLLGDIAPELENSWKELVTKTYIEMAKEAVAGTDQTNETSHPSHDIATKRVRFVEPGQELELQDIIVSQQTPNQRRSMENVQSHGSGSSGSGGGLTSPQASSFSRFQDMEVPLGGTTELNDDAKEKSLRRRSLLDERAARRRSLLSYAAPGTEDGDRRRSMNNNNNAPNAGSKLRPSGTSSLLGVVESHQAPLPALLKVSADSFEQWLKLATDNKINANNSWNFALIDYFHEMSLLREGDSINFQKGMFTSCTLDGCVKIYTSRVDSVATETTKLLGGLATSSKAPEDGEHGDDDDDEENDKPVKKKHASRSGNTLAKDFSALSLEKFNLEFAVDPLFKKTSADFDEGGARGLLLNHLNVNSEGKIIFDAGDARDEGDDDDEEEEEEEPEEGLTAEDEDATERAEKKKPKRKTEVEAAMIDIQRLRSRFLPSLNQIFEKDICPSLKDFQLTGSSDTDFSFLKRFHDSDGDAHDDNDDDDDDGFGIESQNDFDAGSLQDDFDNDFGQVDHYDVDEDQPMRKPKQEEQEQRIEDAFGDLDEQIALQRVGPGVDNFLVDNDDALVKGHTDMYSYFDSALLRNWAGPEHWKLRRAPKEKTGLAADAVAAAGDEEAAGPKKRTGKVPLVINFQDADEVDEDDLFAPAEASSLMFTTANDTENRKSKHVLPDDIHFSSKQLLRMFMKPSFIIKSKSKRHQSAHQGLEAESFNLTFPDEEFWASHTNNVDDDDVAALTDQLDQTQIYNDYLEDDEDDYGFQEQGFFANVGGDTLDIGAIGGIGAGPDGDGNDYASQLVSQPKKVKATFINFSKTAKKVDVKKLKDNIWNEMTQHSLKRQPGGDDLNRKRSRKRANVEAGGAQDGEDEQVETEDEGEDYVKKEQKFTDIIGGLSKVYPEQKLKDISVPFCFICLLHLANEKNLSIEGTEGLAELVIRQQ
ncbi:hypothetical protein BGZ99_004605 [Dissophora globulifera]|uniref:Condensin complex subunit 2 n=1 Tax=Dissophora globulifera TaxID=979702 RepID=A0A9P6UYZ8_9FUNG|nr:hypothetical protein BGZ99_004605 [Dissophora globulifera]